MEWLIGLGIGLAGGVLSGMFGIGGGIIIVPALIYFMQFSQQKAQGTSLAALLLPVGILGFWNYYQKQQADFKIGALVAAGLFVGAFFGSKIAVQIDDTLLRKSFAVFLVLVALQLFFKK
ncbi:MAG: sulfite exporter TauE/SafE family protein [Fimbriimonadaceae bacterium]|nr:sulfite exporter TauE/SafE family protein [Fimbriimonadaceae bacterium]